MNILIATHDNMGSISGQAICVRQYTDALVQLGHHVTIIAPCTSHWHGQATLKPTTTFGFKNKRPLSDIFLLLYICIRLGFQIKKESKNNDILIAVDHFSGWFATSLLFHSATPVLREVHGFAYTERKIRKKGFFNWIYSRLVHHVDRVSLERSQGAIYVAPQLRAAQKKEFGSAPSTYCVAQNGVDLQKFQNNPDTAKKLKNQLQLQNRSIILFTGSMNYWHGVELLLQSIPFLKQQIHNFSIVLVGGGPEYHRLKPTTTILEKENLIIWTNTIEHNEVPAYISMADVCVSPHLPITLQSPLKIKEYFACGKPVIQSRLEGSEYIEEENLGLLFEPENPEDLAEKITTLLHDRNNEARSRRIREYAEEHLSWKQSAESRTELMKKILTV